MRARITASVAVLVLGALSAAGVIVYAVESQRVDAQTVEEVEQELDEFAVLQGDGIDPTTGEPFASVRDLLRLFLERNVPDDDEVLVAWVGDRPVYRFPRDDELYRDPRFLDAVRPLVTTGGSTRIDTPQGRALVATQPVRQRTPAGVETGALVVVVYLAEDRGELHDTMRTYAVVAALLTVLVVAAAAWQSGRLLAPIRVLRETADEIRESDLSRRIPEAGNDDITALTHTLNRMLDRLETAFADQRRFLDDAGHELRTPLTVLRGHLELLDAHDPVDVEETRALLLDEIDRMARLVGDLILLAKSDRPDFVLPTEVHLGELTEDVLAKVRGLGDRDWRLDGTADRLVRVDGQRLTQALLQLADNAVKHTGPGDLVAIGSSYDAAAPPGERLRLWVRDGGPGVPAEDREAVFERFGRSAVPDGDEGFGLGLSIVHAIVAAHGGSVAVTDDRPESPHGARFTITLPTSGASSVLVEEAPWPAS
ncbi:sensor histidine kinase [Nocardioides abyssi]|uniref:histidine kinase n=1 Tax=Nocardioides abyssi TaxID=3058370 RepID=A0ABT8EUK2_9ACTN|nr:HAMP domain-containing sensor histidine kinase [Nocardioides abyssi]MDN4161848.1 HAMP domain-containing sensor histidine kinase [Nocardioides abyssi]